MRLPSEIFIPATLVLLSQASVLAVPVPAPPGEPVSAGQSFIPVLSEDGSEAPVTSVIPHPGAPTGVVIRQDGQTINGEGAAASPTYNDGLYTPWSADSGASATSANVETVTPGSYAVVSTEATSVAAVSTPASSDASVYLQPTAASSAYSATSSSDSETSAATTSASSATVSSTSSSSASSASSPPSASAQSSSAPRHSTASAANESVISTDSPFSGKVVSASHPDKTKTMIIPVAVSVGVLAVLLGILLVWVLRRRAAHRRSLDSRRYGPEDLDEKKYGAASEFDEDEPRDTATWSSFGPNSRAFDDAAGLAGGIAGRGIVRKAYQGVEQQEGDDRGWMWGSSDQPKPTRRGPLPQTPQPPQSESLQSLHEDLDAMIAQSRTGYQPYTDAPKREKSISNIASAIYSSLSGRSSGRGKRFGSKASTRSAGSKNGQWNEHGVWEGEDGEEYGGEHQPFSKAGAEPATQEHGASRPLLACVDETPKKGSYSTYTPPDTPTRDTPGRPRQLYGDDETDVTTAGGSSSTSMKQTYSDDSPRHIRRFTLRDNPVPLLSPGSPRRLRAKTAASSESVSVASSPSSYSPSMYSHASPSSIYPAALQPGQTPAVGWRPSSPPSLHTSASPRPSSPNILTQSVNGPTYSLSGMAGLLYSDSTSKKSKQSDSTGHLTALPPRKPRRQSLLSKYRPTNGSSEALQDGLSPSPSSARKPHLAVDAVVRAARLRGSSVTAPSSADSHYSSSGWDHQVRDHLRVSQASSNSIDDLLTNVLGGTRSPA